VVDGYNLLKQIIKKDIIGDKDRNAFIAQLNKYGQHKKHAIIIVFDGGLLDWPQTENSAGVVVIYSGSRQTADQYIYKYFKTGNKQEALLVSSDADLRRLVSELEIPSLDSESFYILVKRFLSNHAAEKKYCYKDRDRSIVRLYVNSDIGSNAGNDSDSEIDRCMELAAQDIKVKKEDLSPVYGKNIYDKKIIYDNGLSHKKLSRIDQKLFNILKKL